MKLNVFAKKRTRKDGKVFYNYLSTITKKDGTEESVQLKFREDAGQPNPKECPRVIQVNKENANLVKKTVIIDEKEIEQRTLWISKYNDLGDYVDTSLDEYED